VELVTQLRAVGHEIVDFGAHAPNPDDDYPDFVVPLARGVAARMVDRGVAICGSGVGASICANKIPGVRAALIHDHFSARQGVEDDHMNVLCMGGRTGQPSVSLDDIRRFRQLDSKAAGHPEYHWVSGVETTTGPLGQGVATSVGMAIAPEAYRHVLQLHHKPTVLALSRQPLPTLDRSKYAPASGVARGAYVLADAPEGNPEVILIASGSEVSLAVQAHEQLLAENIRSRVVSMPSWDIFEQQSREYQDSVLPPAIKARVAVEQGSTLGWERYVGREGRVIGMHTFGASAPLKELQKKFGFEPDRVVAIAKDLIARTLSG
jgi:RpiB/LacA/LacB family sugar-phosphate isomerase